MNSADAQPKIGTLEALFKSKEFVACKDLNPDALLSSVACVDTRETAHGIVAFGALRWVPPVRQPPVGCRSGCSLKRKSDCGWKLLPYPINGDKYRLGKALGKGAMGEVKQARCQEVNATVAIKQIKLEDDYKPRDLGYIASEVSSMKQLRHRNILPLHAAFVEDDELWLVLPLISGGSVQEIMKRRDDKSLNEHVIKAIMRPVLAALDYLHRNGTMHRDVKAANILIDQEGKVILADMGTAVCLERDHDCSMTKLCLPEPRSPYLSRKTLAGTRCWMAPEVTDENIMYSFAADIWSFGITLQELALGQAPLEHLPEATIVMRILQDGSQELKSPERRKQFTPDLENLVKQCCQEDPCKRPSAQTLLKSPFWKGASAYNGQYLVEELEINTGRTCSSRSLGSNVRSFVRSSVINLQRYCLDTTMTGEEVDVRDGYKLMQRLTAAAAYKDRDVLSFPTAELHTAKGLALAVLSGYGKTLKHLHGKGFVLGRSHNKRKEATWSAPLYFTIDIYGLPPPLVEMEDLHLAIVIPSQDALSLLIQPECSFDGQNPVDACDPRQEYSESRCKGELPKIGYGVCGNAGLTLDLSGAHVKLDARQNGRLYGKDTPAKDILLVTKTKRPAPFNRFIKDLRALVRSSAPAPNDSSVHHTSYHQD